MKYKPSQPTVYSLLCE